MLTAEMCQAFRESNEHCSSCDKKLTLKHMFSSFEDDGETKLLCRQCTKAQPEDLITRVRQAGQVRGATLRKKGA